MTNRNKRWVILYSILGIVLLCVYLFDFRIGTTENQVRSYTIEYTYGYEHTGEFSPPSCNYSDSSIKCYFKPRWGSLYQLREQCS